MATPRCPYRVSGQAEKANLTRAFSRQCVPHLERALVAFYSSSRSARLIPSFLGTHHVLGHGTLASYPPK